MTPDEQQWAPRKQTHTQGQMEQLIYWRGRTIPERLAAATALTRRMYKMRGIDLDAFETDFSPRRVSRRKG
jgi:hypothetical protein